jgi:hypothetical protein
MNIKFKIMINIVLRNKSLIKIYRISMKIFKFLNKHLYILSLLSLFTKARNSIYFRALSIIIKIFLLINLFITSGLFFTFVDLTTPLSLIYEFYDGILNPYKDLILDKYNSLFNINVEDKMVENYANKIEKVEGTNKYKVVSSNSSNISD